MCASSPAPRPSLSRQDSSRRDGVGRFGPGFAARTSPVRSAVPHNASSSGSPRPCWPAALLRHRGATACVTEQDPRYESRRRLRFFSVVSARDRRPQQRSAHVGLAAARLGGVGLCREHGRACTGIDVSRWKLPRHGGPVADERAGRQGQEKEGQGGRGEEGGRGRCATQRPRVSRLPQAQGEGVAPATQER